MLFEACKLDKLTPKEQEEYKQEAMTTKMDRENILLTKWLDGKEEGLAEGREEGRIEGRREGAAKYKDLGVAPEIISQVTGLSLEEIQSL